GGSPPFVRSGHSRPDTGSPSISGSGAAGPGPSRQRQSASRLDDRRKHSGVCVVHPTRPRDERAPSRSMRPAKAPALPSALHHPHDEPNALSTAFRSAKFTAPSPLTSAGRFAPVCPKTLSTAFRSAKFTWPSPFVSPGQAGSSSPSGIARKPSVMVYGPAFTAPWAIGWPMTARSTYGPAADTPPPAPMTCQSMEYSDEAWDAAHASVLATRSVQVWNRMGTLRVE